MAHERHSDEVGRFHDERRVRALVMAHSADERRGELVAVLTLCAATATVAAATFLTGSV